MVSLRENPLPSAALTRSLRVGRNLAPLKISSSILYKISFQLRNGISFSQLLFPPSLETSSHSVFHRIVFLLPLGVLNIQQNKLVPDSSCTIMPLHSVWHLFSFPLSTRKNSRFLPLQIQEPHVLVNFLSNHMVSKARKVTSSRTSDIDTDLNFVYFFTP